MFKIIPAAALALCAAAALVLAQAVEPKVPAADTEPERPAPADGENVPAEPGDDAGTTRARATQTILDKTLPEVEFDGVGLSDVIDFLSDVTSANVFVNWRALEAAGIKRDVPVEARLRTMKFGEALQVILDGAGGGKGKLAYEIENGVITISTAENLGLNTHTRVYDVRDVLQAKPGAVGNAAEPGKRLAMLTKLISGSVAPSPGATTAAAPETFGSYKAS